MYEETTEYIQYMLENGVKNCNNVQRFVGGHNVKVNANELLVLNSHPEIISYIVRQIFQKVTETRSTIEIVKCASDKLGFKIDQQIIDEVLPYLEVRHVFVHSDGKPSEIFLEKYPIFHKGKNGKIHLDINIVRDAYAKVTTLISSYEQEMKEHNLFAASEFS